MTQDAFGIVGSVVAGVYDVEGVVAEGRFGVVYRALHRQSRVPVALKLLKVSQQSAEQRAEFLDAFRVEMELLFRLSASLSSPARPLHADAFLTSDGRFVPYIATEWLDGLTLGELIERRNAADQPPVALRKLARLLTPVARALEHAHHFTVPEGVITVLHGDLKPDNIFIAQAAGEEVVKVLNFRTGKLKSAAGQLAGDISQEAAGLAAFTPAYGAPEQWAPQRYGQAGPWTDVWGFALSIVETLAARPIITGDSSRMMRTALDSARRPTPRTEGVAVSDAVETVFARALSLDPRARQREVGLFWSQLTEALRVPDVERSRVASHDASGQGHTARIELVDIPSRPPLTGSRVAVANPVVESALAMDLEFDPLSVSGKQRVAERAREPVAAQLPSPATRLAPMSADASGPHFVPDLELAPPPVSRRASGARPIDLPPSAQPSVLELDDAQVHSASLDLDLPRDEPISRRPISSARLAAVQIPARGLGPPAPRTASGSMTAQRNSAPPVSAALPARSSAANLDLSSDVTSAGVRTSPRASAPPPPAAFEPHFVARLDLSAAHDQPLLRRLRVAFALLGAALLVAILDPIYAAATGEILKLIGLRLSAFAAALLMLAVGLGVREALRET